MRSYLGRFGCVAVLGVMTCAGFLACASPEDSKRLDAAIARVEGEIEDANLDQARYSSGSLARALVALRLAALKHAWKIGWSEVVECEETACLFT